MTLQLSGLTTEQRNPNSIHLDQQSTGDMLQTINNEDKKVTLAVESVLPQIETAVDKIYHAIQQGGRLFYVGAGTSGRLGTLDASECVPTFMAPPDMVQSVMAGGDQAFATAAEDSEDEESQGAADLQKRNVNQNDVVIGITASGRTPYPIGALKYAQTLGSTTVSLTCNLNSVISRYADCTIEAVVGPEVLTGSTRMKAGTAHKMILNMISTSVMVKMGKVYENLMVDVRASNYKLKERAKHIVIEVTGISYGQAEDVLIKTDGKVKPAIVMILTDVSFEEADKAIQSSGGNVRSAIKFARKKR
ncbi:N-acetylmuramic acid 6-phosphate etherase [Tuberibacillus sp. Marseille-P3662]|uniref:N-acetylmuramic acid 6-phosphate etherase n=1 Tax=Tuberibacillus sp. Marseille-P3662 TaxID=1965358 RepID=UPI000A1CB1D1|nr:N-acetylmuramic acid 6-phosphate etherase [Tuberibacillus sp. Marseille-P3662]